MKSVFKSLFKRRSKKHNDSEPQCDPCMQYKASNISSDLEPCRVQDHSLLREDSQHMSRNNHISTANAGLLTSTWISSVCSLKEISSRHHSSQSSMIVHEDRQEPYDPRPIRDIIQIQQQLNSTATTLPQPNAIYANDRSGPNHTVNDDIGDECSQPHNDEEQHHHSRDNENESRMPFSRSPVSYGLRRQCFHPLPLPDHNSDNGAGVLPNQSSVVIGNASDNGDIKGKGKKRYTALSESVESSTLGSHVQSRIFGNGNPYVVFHSLAQTTPNRKTPAIALGSGSGSGSGSTRYESKPILSDGVRHQGDNRIARIEVIVPSEAGLSISQASGSEDGVDEISSGTTASSTNARLRESSSLQHDYSELSMRSNQFKSISAAENSQLLSANNDFRPRARKTLSLEWCPVHKTLTTPAAPLRSKPQRPSAPMNDSSSRPQRLAFGTRFTSASEHSSQRVKGPRPIPNFEEHLNHKRRSRVLDDAELTNISSEGKSLRSQSETAEQDDSNFVLIKRSSTVPPSNHLHILNVPKGQAQVSDQQNDRPSVVVEMSSHNSGSVEHLTQDDQKFVTDNSSRAHATFGAGTLSEAPSSPITSTGPSTKRLSNTTSRGTARRIIYSADLEQGLPEGRIVRDSNFEIVPSTRVSISSRTNSSAAASRLYTQASQFAEGIDIQGFSTATIVVQSNKRGFGRVRSSEAAQRPNNNLTTAAISTEREGVPPLPEPVDLHKMSDSDEEVDAARYKAEVLKRAAVEAANAANVAAAKAAAAAAEVAEAKAARRRLRNERALKTPVQSCETPCNDPMSSKDSAVPIFKCYLGLESTVPGKAFHHLSDTRRIISSESGTVQFADEIHDGPQCPVTLGTASGITSTDNKTRTVSFVGMTDCLRPNIQSLQPSDDADWTPLVNRWSTPWSPLRNVSLRSGMSLYENQRSGPMAPLIPLIQPGSHGRQRVAYVHHSRAVSANEICILPFRMHSLSMVMDPASLPLQENQNVESTVDIGVLAAQSSSPHTKEQVDNDNISTTITGSDSHDSNLNVQETTRLDLPLAPQSPKFLLPSSTGTESGSLRRPRSLSSIASSRLTSDATAASATRSSQVLINGMTPEELLSSIRFESDHEGTAGYYGPREYARDEEKRRLQDSRDATWAPSAGSGSILMPLLRRVQTLAEMFYSGREDSADKDQSTLGRK